MLEVCRSQFQDVLGVRPLTEISDGSWWRVVIYEAEGVELTFHNLVASAFSGPLKKLSELQGHVVQRGNVSMNETKDV